MNTLFIDTHSEEVLIAIKKDNDVFKINKRSLHSHSIIVMDTLCELLESLSLDLTDINQIIVVNGPGSFTGVRIGVTIAKTLAYSLNIKIKTITSLEAFGISAVNEFDLVTVNDSKGVYSARYINGNFCELEYRKSSEFEKYASINSYNILNKNGYDIEKIIAYLEGKNPINPHDVNPIYIKEIDVLK